MRMMSCRLSANCLNADRVIGGVGIIGLVGIDRIADIVRSALAHGLQVRQIQPRRLLEGAHHLIDPAGLRGAGERHKQVSGCIGLFHLVERALSDQSDQPTGIAGLGLRVRAGGLALASVPKVDCSSAR